MIKLSIGYGEKKQTAQFENNTYHVGFEIEDVEIPDNGTLRKKLGQLFADARQIIKEEQKKDGLVEAEPEVVEVKPEKKTKSKKEKKEEKDKKVEKEEKKPEEAPPSVRDNGSVTNKQIAAIFAICKGRRGMGNREIEEMVRTETGCYRISDLTKEMASSFISQLLG